MLTQIRTVLTRGLRLGQIGGLPNNQGYQTNKANIEFYQAKQKALQEAEAQLGAVDTTAKPNDKQLKGMQQKNTIALDHVNVQSGIANLSVEGENVTTLIEQIKDAKNKILNNPNNPNKKNEGVEEIRGIFKNRINELENKIAGLNTQQLAFQNRVMATQEHTEFAMMANSMQRGGNWSEVSAKVENLIIKSPDLSDKAISELRQAANPNNPNPEALVRLLTYSGEKFEKESYKELLSAKPDAMINSTFSFSVSLVDLKKKIIALDRKVESMSYSN